MINSSLAGQNGWRWRLALVAACLLVGVVNLARAQSRRPNRPHGGSGHVVYAVTFSPDGRTLAISRGSYDETQRYGRIELWDVETGHLRRIIKGFDGPVWSVSFSPDGRTLVSGSTEFRDTKIQGGPQEGKLYAEIKWWDAQTGELRLKQARSINERRTLIAAHSPDGRLLASVEYYTRTYMTFYSNMDASSIGAGTGLSPSLPAISMRNGPTRVSVVEPRLLDARTGEVRLKLKSTLQSYSSSVFLAGSRGGFFQGSVFLLNGGIFSPAGNLLAAGTPEEVRVWSTQTGEAILKLKNFNGRVRAFAFSPDGRMLAIASVIFDERRSNHTLARVPRSEIRFYDVHTGQVINTLKEHGAAISYLAFRPKGTALLIGSLQYEQNKLFGQLKYLDLQTGKLSYIIDRLWPALSFALSPNGRMVASIEGGSSVTLWDTETRQAKRTFVEVSDGEDSRNAHNRFVLDVSRVLAVAFSPDGRTLAAGTEENEITLWDPRTGEIRKRLADHEDAVSSIAISPDGKTLASGSDDQTARLWDVQTGAQKEVLTHDRGPVVSVALSVDGRTLASASGNDVLLWDALTGTLKRKLAAHRAHVNAVVFSSDGRTLASASDDGTVQLWDVGTGAVKKSLATAEGKVTAVSFAPGDRILASASDDSTVSVWDVQTGVLMRRLKQHDAPVNALAFSPDGKWLASGGDDRKVIIWETATWKSKRTLKGHDLTVTSLAFSPDGQLLASGSGNASVILWDMQTGKLNRILR
jgi:WD40 repeat protein